MRKLNAILAIATALQLVVSHDTALASKRTKTAGSKSMNDGALGSGKSAKRSSCARFSEGTCLPGTPPSGPVPIPYPTTGIRN